MICDVIGQELELGDIVVAPSSKTSMSVYVIKKFTKKKVLIAPYKKSLFSGHYRYPKDLCKISDLPETALFLLKN